ncbi:MAG: hypothetical protein AABZ32_02440, partial [Bacteroidota bacterium]
IYEAVINTVLWEKFPQHDEVIQMQTHKTYKPISAFSHMTKMKYGEEDVFPCVYRNEPTHKYSISFKDKVDCAVRIGFVDVSSAGDIKRIYELRNLTHIETEASKQLDVEINQSKTAYWMLSPFLEKISNFLAPL